MYFFLGSVDMLCGRRRGDCAQVHLALGELHEEILAGKAERHEHLAGAEIAAVGCWRRALTLSARVAGRISS